MNTYVQQILIHILRIVFVLFSHFCIPEITQGSSADTQLHRGQLSSAGGTPELSGPEQGSARGSAEQTHHYSFICIVMDIFVSFQDYIDSLKGLCYDGMEGLLYLSLYSFLSALAFTAILCSLPGAWRSFPR